MIELLLGDCLEIMRDLPDNCVDSIVTDPPYGLKFMSKGWDHGVPGEEYWAEALRVIKPGGLLLAFGGTRMVHRLAVAIEDAGWEIRDRIHWVYGSGFPKSHKVALGIDKKFGGKNRGRAIPTASKYQASDTEEKNKLTSNPVPPYEPKHPMAKKYLGWGTALKPAVEPILLARKPFKSTVATNVLEWGTGGINVDECRVPLNGDYKSKANGRPSQTGLGDNYDSSAANQADTVGRWPANLIHDGSDEATDGMGDASRYFYCAKANKRDRGEGNHHPTVKPTNLMAYLCRLITPLGGVILDPFMGSGSTGKAALLEGFGFVGIEKEKEYMDIAEKRIIK